MFTKLIERENKLRIAKKYAESKGGQCLSTEYIGVNVKLYWKCGNKEHKVWQSSYNDSINGRKWCPECAGKFSKEDFLLKAKKYAIEKSGECLSKEYKNSSSKLQWKCSNIKHPIWEAVYGSVVIRGSWCPECAGKFSKEDFLLKAKKYAIKKDGECLSKEYINNSTKMLWKCSVDEHESWEGDYNHVVGRGSWCPKCSTYYYKEHKIRDLLEYLLETKFYKTKPMWNINPKTNKPLELDGYSEDTKIAFEFQGEHHYNESAFNGTKEKLEYIKYKDNIKKENCLKQGVKLLIIDDKFPLKKDKEAFKYVLSLLKINNIKFRKEINEKDVDDIFNKTINHQENYLLKAKEIAKLKDGECLSTKYFYAKEKLIWKCSNIKHPSWEATYDSVSRGAWCKKCAGNFSKEDGLQLSKKIAEEKGGQCLSEIYLNSNTKMSWKCSNVEHPIWDATYGTIQQGGWCPKCKAEKIGKQKKNNNGLKIAQEHAKSKGGECLSEEYVNSNIKLEWKCSIRNHKSWFANFHKVVSGGGWCPVCAGRLEKNDMLLKAKKYAESKGGECLSKEYIKAIEKLMWKCSNKEHDYWLASYHSVINHGTWCPECGKEKRKSLK